MPKLTRNLKPPTPNLALLHKIICPDNGVYSCIQFKETLNCHLRKYKAITKAELPREMCYSYENKAGLPFQSNKLNKLLMIKQIENVRRYTKCWKEFSATLMNGAAYWIFMNYETTRLVPLFHLKLILTGTWPTVLDTIDSVMTLKANFSTLLK